jgi:hypothetical protein
MVRVCVFCFLCLRWSSVGCTVNGSSPHDVQKLIDSGDIEIPSA